MKHPKRHWLLVKFPYLLESAEAVSYYLFERGALGCEEKDGCQFAYFDDRDNDNLLAKLEQDARQIIACGLKLPSGPITISRIPEQDWHLAWRQFFKPVNIQNKLIVRPPWEKIDLPAGAAEIVLEPKQAFGTGTHASTKLMLRAADKFPLIYANLQRHIFIPILPRMIDLLAENGVLLLSGILDTEEQAIRQAIAKYPLVLEKVSHEDEWVLLVTKKCRRNPPKLPSFAECRRNFSATTRR